MKLIKIVHIILLFFFNIISQYSFAAVKIQSSLNNNIKITNIGPFGNLYGVEVNDDFIYIPEFVSGNIYKINQNFKQDLEVYNIEVYNIIDKKFKKTSNYNFLNKLFKKKEIKATHIHDIYFSNEKNFYITSSKDESLIKSTSSGKIYKFDKDWNFLNMIGEKTKVKFPVMTYIDKGSLFVTEYEGNTILMFSDKTFKIEDWIGENPLPNNDQIRFKNNRWINNSNFDSVSLKKPHGIKSDDNFYFIVDTFNHRLLRYEKKNKKFAGWVGKKLNGPISETWNLKLEKTEPSVELGSFNIPIDIQLYDNHLYVSDHAGRIIKINKETGKSIEWFGEISKDKIGWFKDDKIFNSDGMNGLSLPYGFRIFNNNIYTSDRNTNTIKIFHKVID